MQRFNLSWSSDGSFGPEQSGKSRTVAGLLQLFLGWHGSGRFYLGYYGIGAVQLTLGILGLLTTLFCFVGLVILVPLTIWVEVEAAMMFGGAIRDSEGRKLR